MIFKPKNIISRILTFEKPLMSIIEHLTDNIGPRPSGSEAAVKTADFLIIEFENSMLEAHKQTFKHLTWTAEKTECIINNKLFPSIAFHLSGNGEISGNIYYMDNPSKEAFLKADLKDKILVAEASHGMGMHRTAIIDAAIEGGAIAYVQISKIPGGIVETGNISRGGIVKIPALCISYEAGHFLLRNVKRGNGELTLLVKGKESDVTGENVIGSIKDVRNSEETIIVGAHYDTWETGPGAFDNGTGVATLLTLAKILSLSNDIPVNINFIAFGAEELGFKGSMAYRKEYIDTGKLNVPLMMNFDSTAIPKGVRTLMVTNSPLYLQNTEFYVNLYGFDVNINTRPPFGTDGFPFYLNQIPVINLEQMRLDQPTYMHTAFDTPEKLSEDSLRHSTAIVGGLLSHVLSKKGPREV